MENCSVVRGQPRYLLRTLTGIGLLIFQQCSGVNYFFFFGTSVFAGIVNNSYMVPICFSVINFTFTILATNIVDKFRRTTLLLAGSLTLAILMGTFTTIRLLVAGDPICNMFMVIISCVFIAVFAVSWGPVAGVLVSELFPPTIKVKAMSISGSVGWISGFIASVVTPTFGKYMGYIFMGSLSLSVVFVYFLVPETKNLNVDELDELYRVKNYSRKKIHYNN
ncbi:unnamed protein product [Ambrosiozyma monospora]|uniref:Unnamed protein product n=1 Tax=Ambrosiozyma monospora TaxID=43982 RepID=A0A9W6YZ36_AMBMO|nr:unnamed protein product [Ambrosiozyma monospora]